MGLFGVDRYYWPIQIAEGENAIAVNPDDEPGGAFVASVPPRDDYYNHRDGSLDGVRGYALLKAIEDAINAQATTATYTIEAHTPAGSLLQNSGVRITREPEGYFDMWSEGLDLALLGHERNYGGDLYPIDGAIEMPYSIRGCWQSHTQFADRAANAKPRDLSDVRESSTDDDPNSSFEYLWKSFTFRDIEYPRVPAMHVWHDPDMRGAHEAYWQAAGLPEGDHNNTLEDLWRAARRKDEIIIVHDEGDQDLQVTSHPYEIAILRDKAQRTRFRELFAQERRQGETYDLALKWSILDGTYTH